MTNFELLDLKTFEDGRGSLIALEKNYNVPFEIKRVYYIFDTQKNVSRGFHAHVNLKQLVIALKGSCTFFLDNGKIKEEIVLNTPSKGLLIEGLIWREMHNFSEDCILLVLASEYYDEKDYIRDYQSFIEAIK